jgi:hypothetical protein
MLYAGVQQRYLRSSPAEIFAPAPSRAAPRPASRSMRRCRSASDNWPMASAIFARGSTGLSGPGNVPGVGSSEASSSPLFALPVSGFSVFGPFSASVRVQYRLSQMDHYQGRMARRPVGQAHVMPPDGARRILWPSGIRFRVHPLHGPGEPRYALC